MVFSASEPNLKVRLALKQKMIERRSSPLMRRKEKTLIRRNSPLASEFIERNKKKEISAELLPKPKINHACRYIGKLTVVSQFIQLVLTLLFISKHKWKTPHFNIFMLFLWLQYLTVVLFFFYILFKICIISFVYSSWFSITICLSIVNTFILHVQFPCLSTIHLNIDTLCHSWIEFGNLFSWVFCVCVSVYFCCCGYVRNQKWNQHRNKKEQNSNVTRRKRAAFFVCATK